jgi:hypothetical protein
MENVRFLKYGDPILEDAILTKSKLRSSSVEAVDW